MIGEGEKDERGKKRRGEEKKRRGEEEKEEDKRGRKEIRAAKANASRA